MFKFLPMLTEEICKENKTAIVVFGDNLIGRGKAGHDVIRDEPNAFGVPTKRLPSMASGSFFSDKDDEYLIVKEKLIFLWNEHLNGKTIILPVSQIGSGLAKLQENAPKIAALIERFYKSAYATTIDTETVKTAAAYEDESILINQVKCYLNTAPFSAKWGDLDTPENYLTALDVPEEKIKEFEKLGFIIWIQDDTTKNAVMYIHQNEMKKNIRKATISKEDLIDFEVYQTPTTTSYYAFLSSKESFSYLRFYEQNEMNNEINTPHSSIRIGCYVLNQIEEKCNLDYGELTKAKFNEIRSLLRKNFGQEIVPETTRCARYSEAAKALLYFKKTPPEKPVEAISEVDRKLKDVYKKISNNTEKGSKTFYQKLSKADSEMIRADYTQRLLLDIEGNISTPFYTQSGIHIADGYQRVVIGDYGAYVEFSPENIKTHLLHDKFPHTPNRPVKYIWMETEDKTKVYFQQNTVAYADYKPNMYYVSPQELKTDSLERLYNAENTNIITRFNTENVDRSRGQPHLDI